MRNYDPSSLILKCWDSFSKAQLKPVMQNGKKTTVSYLSSFQTCKTILIISFPIVLIVFFQPFKFQPRKMVKHTQAICRLLPTNSLSVFDHFVGLSFLFKTNKNIRTKLLFLLRRHAFF